MYHISIFQHNQEHVSEYFSTVEEARERIKSWPWDINPDNCALSLCAQFRISEEEED